MPSSATTATRGAEPPQAAPASGLPDLRAAPDAGRPGGGSPATDGSAVGGPGVLALFLLLCGVFASLVTQGRPDTGRAVLAVGSVRAALGGPAGWSVPGARGEGGTEEAEGPLGGFARAGTDGPLRLELDSTRLFDADGRVVRARLFLFARLAAASRAGWEIRVLAPDGGTESLARLGDVLRLLEAHGAVSARLLVGLDPRGSGRWRFEARPGESAA